MVGFPADLQALLDQLEPQVRDAFLSAIQDMRSEAQMALAIDAILSGNLQRLYVVLNLDPAFLAPLDTAIQNAYIQGGIRALAGLPVIRDPAGPGKSLSASTGAIPVRSGGQGSDPQR